MIKHFEDPDEVHNLTKGRFEIVHIGGLTLGRATYEPGWRWTTHFRPSADTDLCEVEHVGFVVSGHCVAEMADGTRIDLKAGDLFHVPPGHDSWVVGDEQYVSLHFTGVDKYAR